MEKPTSNALKRIAVSAAFEAGQRSTKIQGTNLKIDTKGYRDFVTEADFLAQATITGIIQDSYPDHGFLTEELDESLPGNGPIIWIIDPIDGTTNYSRNHPNFTISVAAADNVSFSDSANSEIEMADLQPIAGAIYDPIHSEMFASSTGEGTVLNKNPIRVSEINTLSDALVGVDWGRTPEERSRMLALLSLLAHKVHSIRAVGSAAQALSWVACGRLEAYINLSIGPWDCAAAKVLISEAGGSMSSLRGNPWQVGNPGCIAHNGNLLGPLLDLVVAAEQRDMG